MGEVLVSSEAGTELDTRETEAPLQAAKMNSCTDGGGAAAPAAGSSSAGMWERFLQKMVVRVLLVEADVSTRQVIAALLRKCSYKVAAVSDGLKAWEVLKERPHNIDLILTEVDLPSISGYALLSLIMEHDVCKNIPVIMMSSNDSVSTVYKCMLKGASDFLVKPLRKNELRNLWQHVWRKQTSTSATASGPGPPDETVAQQRVEATAENNAVSNHSSGYIASLHRNRECIVKGSDAQSSCTKPDVETEGTNIKHARSVSSQESYKCLQDNIPTQEEGHQESRKTYAQESRVDAMARGRDENSNNVIGQNSGTNHVLENCSIEVIDFIGAFDNYLKGTLRSSATYASANKFDSLPVLDLYLRKSNPGCSVQVNDERHRLNHSDASPFSRYINDKPSHANIFSSPSTCNNQKDHESYSEKHFSNHTTDHTPDTHGPTIGPQNNFSVAKIQPLPSDILSLYPQQREISLPIPVKGVRIDINAHGSVVPQMYCTQSPLPSHQSESFTQLYQFHNQMDQRLGNDNDQTDNKQGHGLEDKGNVYPVNDQSSNSNFCNGKINSVSVVMATAEGGNEEALPHHESASHRSILREAALRKFRMKRKERCFDKKVRYVSRKKLAEQRPRVKGQFVRQAPNDPQSGNSSPG